MAEGADQVMSGARMELSIEGITVSRSTNIRWSRQWQNARVDAHGKMASYEIEPIGYTVNLSCSTVYLRLKSLRTLGITPPAKDTKACVTWPAMTALVYDEVGDVLIARIVGLKPQQEDFDSPGKGLITYSGSWEGTEMFMDAEA